MRAQMPTTLEVYLEGYTVSTTRHWETSLIMSISKAVLWVHDMQAPLPRDRPTVAVHSLFGLPSLLLSSLLTSHKL